MLHTGAARSAKYFVAIERIEAVEVRASLGIFRAFLVALFHFLVVLVYVLPFLFASLRAPVVAHAPHCSGNFFP